jgi:hypothetical protein
MVSRDKRLNWSGARNSPLLKVQRVNPCTVSYSIFVEIHQAIYPPITSFLERLGKYDELQISQQLSYDFCSASLTGHLWWRAGSLQVAQACMKPLSPPSGVPPSSFTFSHFSHGQATLDITQRCLFRVSTSATGPVHAKNNLYSRISKQGA